MILAQSRFCLTGKDKFWFDRASQPRADGDRPEDTWCQVIACWVSRRTVSVMVWSAGSVVERMSDAARRPLTAVTLR